MDAGDESEVLEKGNHAAIRLRKSEAFERTVRLKPSSWSSVPV